MFRCKVIAFLLFTLTAFQLPAADVVCTAYPIWLLTKAVAGNAPGVEITLLMNSQHGCAHDYTPAPKDLTRLMKNGTLLIANGLGLDDHIINTAKKVNKQINISSVADQNDTLDAHYFINPDNAKIMLEKIAFILSKDSPDNREIYYANKARYDLLLNELSAQFKKLPPRQTVVLQSSTFIHLAKASNYNIILIKKDHDSVLSTKELRKLLQTIKTRKTSAVWCEKGSADPVIAMLQKQTNLPIIELDSMLHGIDDPPADHFINLMRANLKTLQKAAAR